MSFWMICLSFLKICLSFFQLEFFWPWVFFRNVQAWSMSSQGRARGQVDVSTTCIWILIRVEVILFVPVTPLYLRRPTTPYSTTASFFSTVWSTNRNHTSSLLRSLMPSQLHSVMSSNIQPGLLIFKQVLVWTWHNVFCKLKVPAGLCYAIVEAVLDRVS